MPSFYYVLAFVGIILFLFCIQALFSLFFYEKKMSIQEQKINDIFLAKMNKIPALIEFLRPYVVRNEAFDEVIGLHIRALILNRESVYDILEINDSMSREFEFLFRLATKIPELAHNSLFTYLQHVIIYQEEQIHQELYLYNSVVVQYNKKITQKNWSIFGLLYPADKKMGF